MTSTDDRLAPVRAMLAALDRNGRETLTRALHRQLNAPVPARACARAIGHIPSSTEYEKWQVAVTRSARETGRRVRVAYYAAVLRELAPDRCGQNGWRLVKERVFPIIDRKPGG